MATDARTEQRAILTKAATVEAQRQLARQRGDEVAVREYERELRQLWSRHRELEHQVA
jgi:hypothetical protein